MSMKKKAAKKPAVAKKAKASAVKAAAPKKAKTKAPKATKATKASKTAAKAPASAKKSKVVAAGLPNKPISEKQSKSQIYAELADIAQISKSDVRNVVSAMRNIIERHVKVKGSGEVTIPDLGIKVRRVQKKLQKLA